VGRAPRQVDEFLENEITPMLRRIHSAVPSAAQAEVSV
jgi:hypothetical protein